MDLLYRCPLRLLYTPTLHPPIDVHLTNKASWSAPSHTYTCIHTRAPAPEVSKAQSSFTSGRRVPPVFAFLRRGAGRRNGAECSGRRGCWGGGGDGV